MKLLGLICLGVLGGSTVVLLATYVYDELQWRAIERRARLSNPIPPRPAMTRLRGECG